MHTYEANAAVSIMYLLLVVAWLVVSEHRCPLCFYMNVHVLAELFPVDVWMICRYRQYLVFLALVSMVKYAA